MAEQLVSGGSLDALDSSAPYELPGAIGVVPPLGPRAAKRTLDIVVAGALLVALLPLLMVIALRIRGDSPGPVLFRQRRIGKNGEGFWILKFRTMVADAEALQQSLMTASTDRDWLKLGDDPRITHFGRVLRRTSLDELPQLINVLRGEMSLVGPRPLIPAETARIPAHLKVRDLVRPGLTGLWQVSGRTDLSFREMLELDAKYVRDWRLVTDLALLSHTLPAVFLGRGAN